MTILLFQFKDCDVFRKSHIQYLIVIYDSSNDHGFVTLKRATNEKGFSSMQCLVYVVFLCISM